ncbi:HEAT repeat protein-like protein [Calycina marina]|uniref:HEAT repeat protein-like protein n=1 Tax=Calycina marina TaxID=1763456 RepID=A0A9P8CHJ2_9HELO|nr:HEAT repeat protein-like protein [Calycina marina]
MALHLNVGELPPDNVLVKWLETEQDTLQADIVTQKFEELLANAAQPRHASGNACLKLCHFVEQCRRSKSSTIMRLIISEGSCLSLFNFFIEWSEKNQNRSMRQILELTNSLIAKHPDVQLAAIIKASVLKRELLIITHRAAQPLVKPAFKSLECFLSKSTIYPHEILDAYEAVEGLLPLSADDSTSNGFVRWDAFMSMIFSWMKLADISPAAGKFLATLFEKLRIAVGTSADSAEEHGELWQRWVRQGIEDSPGALESVKHQLLSPLFKTDRSGSIAFLKQVNNRGPSMGLEQKQSDSQSLLQLAAIEVGKKAGLVDTSSAQNETSSEASVNVITLNELAIEPLLAHASSTVRSLAFSVLVSSSSSTKPFTNVALAIIRRKLAVLHADTDAKFRNEILSQTKHMIERIRGATTFLTREIQKAILYPKGSATESTILEASLKRELNTHNTFVKWYLEFLLGELVPTASYQRHATALKAINLVLRSDLSKSIKTPAYTAKHATVWPYSIPFFTTGSLRLLLDLIVDPFEDVRVNATIVLKHATIEDFDSGKCSTYLGDLLETTNLATDELIQTEESQLSKIEMINGSHNLGLLKDFISRASEVSKRTGRADYADGVARCYMLLYSLLNSPAERLELVRELVTDLSTRVAVAEKSLAHAVAESPIHGVLAALNLIWESIDLLSDCADTEVAKDTWNRAQQDICLSCERLWAAVRGVLCNDSPEGHLPEDIDEIGTIDTKDVLSYSFRAVHESSNLLRSMAGKIGRTWRNGSPMLVTEIFVRIGNLTFTQLSTLRHRGAFSTVTLTFAKCCQLVQKHALLLDSTDSDQKLLPQWYQGALACIFEQASTTRRSAGIPALITGIMSANAQDPAFEEVMAELKRIAKLPATMGEYDKTNLPQVHAMNCLKDIFKSAALGKLAGGQVPECLELAADTLSSEIWAIRNCALILLRSLIDCLFGTHESKNITEAGWDGRSIKLSYDEYPTLPSLLMKLLGAKTGGSEVSQIPTIGLVESVFPALDIIRRVGPPPAFRDEIFAGVAIHLSSKLWHVREIAARTLCTLMLHKDWLAALLTLVESAGESTNRLHGTLMAIRFTLERRLELNILPSEDFTAFAAVIKFPSREDVFDIDPEVLSVYLEIENIGIKVLLGEQKTCQEPPKPAELRLFGEDANGDYTCLKDSVKSTLHAQGGPAYGLFANLGTAIARRAVYLAALMHDTAAMQPILVSMHELGIDSVLAGLECLPVVWFGRPSLNAYRAIFKAYSALIKSSKSPEVCATALAQFTATLQDQHFDYVEDDEILLGLNLGSFEPSNHVTFTTPSLYNAELASSGFAMLSRFMSQKSGHLPLIEYDTALAAWGPSLCMALDVSNDFDMRYAAVEALSLFYGAPQLGKDSMSNEHAIPSVFALYDSLNDDDDELRDLSAATVSTILGMTLLPLAAQAELVKLIQELYSTNDKHISRLISRMTGTELSEHSNTMPEPRMLLLVKSQLAEAMQEDSSLFAEEKQNLFVDEVREAQTWCEVFRAVNVDDMDARSVEKLWREPLGRLNSWVLAGLQELRKILAKENDSLSWTSKPVGFGICMRIILCANAALDQRNRLYCATGDEGWIIKEIEKALTELTTIGREKKLHESLLNAIDR